MILSRGKFLAAISFLILVLQPATLWATPGLQQKRSQADQLAREIDDIDDRSEVAVEQYNQAQIKLGRIQQQVRETRGRLAKAEADLLTGQKRLNQRVTGIYKSGETIGVLEVMLSARNIGDFISAVESLARVSKHDARLLRQIKKYRLEVQRAERALAEQEKAQAATTGTLRAKKNDIQAQLRERQAALSAVRAEITRTENAQAASARLASVGRAPAAPMPKINIPPSGRGAAVVRLAMAQLGKPYVWAAAGPNAFDCSGLTMYVYAQVGVSLPHSAQAQFNMGQRVGRDQLQPGDLIYGGSGGYISHVGIYIGGDSYISAPRTGDVVKIQSLSARSNYAGATRP